jgi:hypothetical protein
MSVNVNNIRFSALLSDSYYDLLDWNQFLRIAEQSYLKLDDALNRSISAIPNSGRWIDAQVDVQNWNDVTLKMCDYVRTKVPYFMYEQFNEYIEDVLNEAEKNRC